MKCPSPSCGKEITEDSKYCEYCGAQVKKNSKPLLITLFVVIGLLALGGFGYYQYDKASEQQEEYARTHGSSNGYDWVDLGLSVKWATCNVGATSPEEYGDYFAWGETSPKEEYTEENSLTYGKQMSDIAGNAQYDAARANWGGNWRMPTETEMQELMDKCEPEWVTVNGVNGCKVTGPNGNNIFLPAAGCGCSGVSSLVGAGHYGIYWSSTPYESDSVYAYCLDFDSDYYSKGVASRRYNSHPVRPVLE